MTRYGLIFLMALFIRIVLTSANKSNGSKEFTYNVTELIEEYKVVRKEEILIEENMWTGANILVNNKTNEKEAIDVFMKYKSEELRKCRNKTSENPAAMFYYDAIDLIERSNVYQLIRKMPKGANLNIHALGSVSTDWLVENFTRFDTLKYCMNNGTIRFTFREDPHRSFGNCTELTKFRKYDCSGTFDQKLQQFFDLKYLRSKNKVLTFGEVVNSLLNMFVAISDAVNYKPAYKKFHYQMLQELYDDNIMYAEIRTEFFELYDRSGKKYTREETVQTLIDVVNDFKETHKDFLGVKFIYSIVRHISRKEIKEEIQEFKKLQRKFPKDIIGLDFVGWEDYGVPLAEYWQTLIKLKHKGYDFYFLAGETNHFGHTSDFNLYDALLLKSKRIGHGYALWKHPIIMERLVNESVAIEICPVSNQISGLVSDLRNHPGGIYLSQDMPLVVGSDSPGFFGTKGLSTDFYYMIMSLASNKADLRTLKQLALNSILHSALGKEEQQKARDLFLKKWKEFLNKVVHYGSLP